MIDVMDWMFMSPLKFIYSNSTHQCDNIKRWGLWKVIRIRWSYEGGILKNGILTGITRKNASLLHYLPFKNTIPSPPQHNLFFYLIIACFWFISVYWTNIWDFVVQMMCQSTFHRTLVPWSFHEMKFSWSVGYWKFIYYVLVLKRHWMC